MILTDGSKENCDRAGDFLRRSALSAGVEIRRGDALQLLEASPGPFDIIFCDIDKHDYPRIHPLLGSRLRSGGLFIADNMLWFGRVAGPDRDVDTLGVRKLTRLLCDDPALRNDYELPDFS